MFLTKPKKKNISDPNLLEQDQPFLELKADNPVEELNNLMPELNYPSLREAPVFREESNNMGLGIPDQLERPPTPIGRQLEITDNRNISGIESPMLGMNPNNKYVRNVGDDQYQIDSSNLDPLTRAKRELGERKSPGFWGRLGQGLRALATGDGVGGFVLGLGDTYGQADHRARLQELASQYDEENKLKQQAFANRLNARKQDEAERYGLARTQDLESRIADRENRLTFAEKQLDETKKKNLTMAEDKDKEISLKEKKYTQDNAIRRAQSLIDIMRYSGKEIPEVVAELSTILNSDLPKELLLPLQNQWQMTKAGLLNKTTGEVRPNSDPMGNRFTINISDGRGRGGSDRSDFRPMWREEPITDRAELIKAKALGSKKTKPVLYYTDGGRVIKAGTDPSGNYLSAEESIKLQQPVRVPFIRR